MNNEASKIIEIQEKRKLDLTFLSFEGIRGKPTLKKYVFEDIYKVKSIWWTRKEIPYKVGQRLRVSLRLKYIEVKPDGENIYYIKHLRVLEDLDE